MGENLNLRLIPADIKIDFSGNISIHHGRFESEDSKKQAKCAAGEAAGKYIPKTKAFVSTSSMLFVLTGYGGSLYDIWMNGVWGEAKQQ